MGREGSNTSSATSGFEKVTDRCQDSAWEFTTVEASRKHSLYWTGLTKQCAVFNAELTLWLPKADNFCGYSETECNVPQTSVATIFLLIYVIVELKGSWENFEASTSDT